MLPHVSIRNGSDDAEVDPCRVGRFGRTISHNAGSTTADGAEREQPRVHRLAGELRQVAARATP